MQNGYIRVRIMETIIVLSFVVILFLWRNRKNNKAKPTIPQNLSSKIPLSEREKFDRAVATQDQNEISRIISIELNGIPCELRNRSLLRLLETNLYVPRSDIIDILSSRNDPNLIVHFYDSVCSKEQIEPPASYMAYCTKYIQAISNIGTNESYNAIKQLSKAENELISNIAREKLENWNEEIHQKQYSRMPDIEFNTDKSNTYEAYLIFKDVGALTVCEWAKNGFNLGEIDGKLADLAILNDLSSNEIDSIIFEAFSEQELPIPNNDFEVDFWREKLLIYKYTNNKISVFEFLNLCFKRFVWEYNTDIKFLIWRQLEEELDDGDPSAEGSKMNEDEITVKVDSFLRKQFLILDESP